MIYPNINPVALDLGFVKIHWYGVMYAVSFGLALALGNYRASRSQSDWNYEKVSDLVFYCALSAVIGGRVGYAFFYNFPYLLENPSWLFKIWEGGMSFHGGLLGVLIAGGIWGRRQKKSIFDVYDFIVPLIPLGLGCGRLGNFIGQELWGRASNVPWAMVFPKDPLQLTRHPSQLYQAFLEGIVLFISVWWYSSKPRPKMAVSGLFLLIYVISRFIVEFVREPDSHLGLYYNFLSIGQMLSLPMIFVGVFFMISAYQKHAYINR